jgi:glycosyltransferase involved in cell wall biosynthesis
VYKKAFAVVTTTFNDADGIIGFLDNIINQSMKPSVIIITDGGSKDTTVNLIKEYATTSEVPIHLFSPRRMNISEGFNYSIRQASTEFVCVSAVGNRYPKNFFERMMAPFYNDLDLDLVCANVEGEIVNEFSKIYSSVILPSKGISLSGNHGMMVKTSLFEDIGYFYEKFHFAGEDEEFLQRVINCGKAIKVLPDCYVHWLVPCSWKEYSVQIKRYVIAVMQIYSNKIIFQIYKRPLIYTTGILVGLVCLLINPVRFTGVALFFLYAILNARMMLKKGFKEVCFRNYKFLMTTLTLISEWKFLKDKNKIEKQYRLSSRKRILENSTIEGGSL